MDTSDSRKILIDVEAQTSQAEKSIQSLTNAIKQLKTQQKELNSASDQNKRYFTQLAVAIDRLNTLLSQNQASLQSSAQAFASGQDALTAFHDSIADLTDQFTDLEQALQTAQDDSPATQFTSDTLAVVNLTQAIVNAIQTLQNLQSAQQNAAEQSVQFQNNLAALDQQFSNIASQSGLQAEQTIESLTAKLTLQKQASQQLTQTQNEFTQSFVSLIAGNNKAIRGILNMAVQGKSMSGILQLAKGAVTQLSGAFKKLLTDPILLPIALAIAAIAAAVNLVVKAFQHNRQASEKLHTVTAKLKAIFNLLLDALGPFVNFLADALVGAFNLVADVIDGTLHGLSSLLSLVGLDSWAQAINGVTSAAEKASQNVDDLNTKKKQLSKTERDYRFETQKRTEAEKELSRQINDSSLSYTKRIELNKKLTGLINQQADANIRLKQQKLDIAKLGNDQKAIDDAQFELNQAQNDKKDKNADQQAQQNRLQEGLLQDQQQAHNKQIQETQRYNQKQASLRKAAIQEQEKDQIRAITQDQLAHATTLAQKQAAEAKIFETENNAQRRLIDLQLNYHQITRQQADQQYKNLDQARDDFQKKQQAQNADFAKQTLQQLNQVVGLSSDQQVDQIKQKYDKLRQQIQTVLNTRAPQRLPGMSDQDYADALEQYKKTILQMSNEAKNLDLHEQTEIAEAKNKANRKQYDDIDKLVDAEYKGDLEKFKNNQQQKDEITLKALKEKKERYQKAGLDTTEVDAEIFALQKQQLLTQKATDLLQSGDHENQKYSAKMQSLKSLLTLTQQYYDDELGKAKDNADQTKQLEADKAKAIDEIQKKMTKTTQDRLKKIAGILGAAQSDIDTAYGEINGVIKQHEDEQLEKDKEANDQKKQNLKNRLDNGQISQKEYNDQVAQLDQELDQKKAAMTRKQAERDKAQKVFDIITSTAQAIMKAWGQTGIFGAFTTPVIAAMGALQLATVLAQPLPKASRGMLLQGPSHASGGIPIEAEGGEAIINKKSTALFRPLLSAINQAGGGIAFSTLPPDGGYSARAAASVQPTPITPDDLTRAVQKVKIYTAIDDIHRQQTGYITITDLSY